LELGRIEALRETGGLLAHPRVVIANAAMELAVTLEIDQYLETGDPWGTRDPAVCRVFDADGHELRHLKLAAPPQVPAGVSTVHLEAGDPSPARARVTVILKGENIH
jgi:hypothetical protein